MTKRGADHSYTWLEEIRTFFKVFDERFEDYRSGLQVPLLFRDTVAGVVVALIAIPLGIGFAVASGLRPEQGIMAGAFAGLLGGLFGGSKYQVYGATAAFIPVLTSIVHKYDVPFLLLASVISGIIIGLMGVLQLGKKFSLVPYSVIVGFTIGIAASIAVTQMPYVLGDLHPSGHTTVEKILQVPGEFVSVHAHALVLALFTFLFVRKMNKISVLIPGALIAMIVCAIAANYVWKDELIPLISTQYGDIGGRMFALTMPSLGHYSLFDLIYPVAGIVLIGSLESLLSARMADRLAGNHTPYSPNKELFGQGVVNLVVPFLNGFPCTGALARTATNIKLGAVSPLSSIVQGFSIILVMSFFATSLSGVPMACVGGLLLYVASNMVKKHEIQVVLKSGKLNTFLMGYTAVMTVATDLCVAVLSACAIFYLLRLIVSAHLPHLDLRHLAHPDMSVSSLKEAAATVDPCPKCGFQEA